MQNSQLDTGESQEQEPARLLRDSSDFDILLQNTSLFKVKIYHQGEESKRQPDSTFLSSAIARMYHDPTVLAGHATRHNGTIDLKDRDQLWNTIVDKVTGGSLSTRMGYPPRRR